MKRLSGIFEKIVDRGNIHDSIHKACRNHMDNPLTWEILANEDRYVEEIHDILVNRRYSSSDYEFYDITDNGKVRHIAKIGFYPDRIIHWCIINVTRKLFINRFVHCTFGAIEGRGTHGALKLEKRYLKDVEATQYVLKIDIHHFFESIDKDILMSKLRRMFKEEKVLSLFAEVIYGFPGPGLPIGNLTSQYLANFYLSDFDHYLKEILHARHYLRNMDDCLIFGQTKSWLRRVLKKIIRFLDDERLHLNHKYQISPVDDRGADFVGYKGFHGYTLVRPRIRKNIYKVVKQIMGELEKGMGFTEHMQGQCSAYSGILKWCDSFHLRRKTIRKVEIYVKKNCSKLQQANCPC